MVLARKVWYYYDDQVGNYHFGKGHPMRPQVCRMAHTMIKAYGLESKMACFRPQVPIPANDLAKFHSDDYIEFLKQTESLGTDPDVYELWKYNIGLNCPLFPGMFEYCQLYATGSVIGARKLNQGVADVVINWTGGMHKPRSASTGGFVPVNDCVLAILELLRSHDRVLYVDIDADHCTGVEEAFYVTNRVMTVSFHLDKESGGHMNDIGTGEGKGYSLNFPLEPGADDYTYEHIFGPLVGAAITRFKPQAIVYQSGANSLGGDRLGQLNLSLWGHGACLQFINAFDIPLLVLGGSGYNLRNTARCWAYETGLLVGQQLPNDLPRHPYYEHYSPEYRLHFSPMSYNQNSNSTMYLDAILHHLLSVIPETKLPEATVPETTS